MHYCANHRHGRGDDDDPQDRGTDESLDAITDALLTASRLLVAISAVRSQKSTRRITFPQFRTLVILSSHGPLKLATLAGLLEVQPSTIGRMVDRLLSAGLIERRPNPASRRELLIELHPADRGGPLGDRTPA